MTLPNAGVSRGGACCTGVRVMTALVLLSFPRSAPSGDLLRGGASASNGARTPGPSPAAAQAAAQSRSNAKDALARTSRAVEAVQRAQLSASRAAAGANHAGADPNHPGMQLPDVPNGLRPGGLQVAAGAGTDPSVWAGAFLPTQTGSGGKTQVNIRQTSAQAVLNWETFNVGRDTGLHFDQSAGGENAGQWIAFNKVNDPSGRPSQILGSITAPGQVYVVNQNGIIFGGASQVNVHTLVASSLPINDNLIRRGLLNQASTAQFLFSALPQTGEVPFTPPPLPASGKIGDVTVQAGAQLISPTTDANVGGRIALIGPNVTNHGTISTPDGQTILAAGLQVGFAAHSAGDPSLRGLDVFVGQVGPDSGKAANHGLIRVERGSAYLTGRDVLQAGAIESTTSISLNGRIDLKAEFNALANPAFDPQFADLSPPFLFGGAAAGNNTGQVVFGPGSVTRILPEYGSPDKVIGTQLALRSRINARGRTIHVGQGGLIHLPNAVVNFDAGQWDYAPGTTPTSTFVRSGGQIYLDRDSLIQVAGTPDAHAALSQHILTVSLRSAELADSPLLRDSLFRGGEITVDLRKSGVYNGREWVGTPLADLRGYLNLIERTVGELTVAGGTVNLNSGGSIIVRDGATIDTSAGWVNYGSGTVNTTRLLYQGRLVDIATATPDRNYGGIYTGEFVDRHPRWNIERTYRVPWMTGEHFEEGYLHGANAGVLALAGSSMALDGDFRSVAVSGPRQTVGPAIGGTLDLSFEVQQLVPGTSLDPLISPEPPAIVFGPGTQAAPGAFAVDAAGDPLPLREERKRTVVLNPDLLADRGFASLKIRNPDGNITVPRGIELKAPPGGSIALEGANITVLGDVRAPGGSLFFAAYNISPSVAEALKVTTGAVLPGADPGRGRFTLGRGASLDAAGLVLDHRPSGSTPFTAPQVTDGGSVSIRTYAAALSAGSVIDVSGGVVARPRGGFEYGDAGSIEIITGRDLSLPAVDGGSIRLEGTLKGFSGARGGSLSIQAQLIRIGRGGYHPLALQLAPDFFNQGGFSEFILTGIGLPGDLPETSLTAVNIAPGTRIEPEALGYLAVPFGGGTGELQLTPYLKPEGLRSPVSLSFNALGSTDPFANRVVSRGDIVFGQGALIRTDGLGSVSFRGDTVTVLGSVTAPGGSITIAGGNSFKNNDATPAFALPTVYIGNSARLSTAGKPLIQTGVRGYRQGTILAGGTISVSGNIVAERGAALDVSGSSGVLDLPPSWLNTSAGALTGLSGTRFVPVRIESDAGSISLRGGQLLYSDATLIGRPGGPSAAGGSLSVSSGRFYPNGASSSTADTNLLVRQSGLTLTGDAAGRGVGVPLTGPGGTPLPGFGHFNIQSLAGGGFNSLTLGGNVEFDGPVTIDLAGRLRVGTGGVIRANDAVRLSAPYVALGQVFLPPALTGQTLPIFSGVDASGNPIPDLKVAPTFGTGSLHVTARLIDVGNLLLQGIGETRLNAANGDIRGNGTLSLAGRLNLTAGQIYPTTLSQFSIFAYDYTSGGSVQPGTITVRGGAYRDLPLSGGGTLSLYASRILQGGTLRAPIGAINLGWDGTGTAPVDAIAGNTIARPVTSELVLGAGSVTSVSAVDPRTGKGILIPYGISLDGITYIDPAGNDITVTGVPEKRINLSAANLTTEAGSVIDIRGGGDLFAYRWVPGNGGSQDILASSTSFAVIPGFGADFAPYAPFNPSGGANLGGQSGYTNNSLRPGDTVTLGVGAGLPAGTYTLLPARYALLPGAWLITPKSGGPVGSFALPDGSAIVSGYRGNRLDEGRTGVTLMARYEVAPAAVVLSRAQYEVYSADSFIREASLARDFTPTRLPSDSGYLSFNAGTSMVLNGTLLSTPIGKGRGSIVDINSSSDILINTTGSGGGAGILVLSTPQLNSFNAESLLIGGLRRPAAGGSSVLVNSGSITVDNAGTALRGADLILVAKNSLTLENGSTVLGSGKGTAPEALFLGSAETPGSGNGTLLRVSAQAGGGISRQGVSDSMVPAMTVGAGATVGGGSITLDSTYATSLDPLARLEAPTVALNSGQITLVLENSGTIAPTPGLVLAGAALASLQNNARRLSLLSYSSLDIYGSGQLGSRGIFDSLSLSAATFRGYNSGGGTVTLAASAILIDNATGRAGLAVPAGPGDGQLVFDADQVAFGINGVQGGGFAETRVNAVKRILMSGSGSFRTGGNLTLDTPLLTSDQAVSQRLQSEGALTLNRPAAGGSGPGGGLGAKLVLQGSSVALNSDIFLPAGELTARAVAGDLTVGNLEAASLNLGGTARSYLDVVRYADAGIFNAVSDTGSVRIAASALVNLSAPQGGGNAGQMNVSAPQGVFDLEGGIQGRAANGWRTGAFTLDAGSLAGGDLADIDARLNEGSFTGSRQSRFRTGDVLISSEATALSYQVSADQGSILVTGTINASGMNGGTIGLRASDNLVLADGAVLNAAGLEFSHAGKGGSVVLEAGTQRDGTVNAAALLEIREGSLIDLSVASGTADSPFYGQFTGTLHLRAPRNAAQTDFGLAALQGTIRSASSILAEGYRLYDLTGSGGALTTTIHTSILNDSTLFLGPAGASGGNDAAITARLLGADPQNLASLLVMAPGAEVINRTGNLVLGSASSGPSEDWNLENWRFGAKSAPGVLTLRASGNLTFYNTLSDGFAAVTPSTTNGNSALWLAPLMAHNPLLPINSQSWSYRLAAGADLSAAGGNAVLPVSSLASGSGYIELGKNLTAANATGGNNALTASLISGGWQVIRTGSGDISLSAGRSMRFLNPLASVYTAGTQVGDSSRIFTAGDFVVPEVRPRLTPSQGSLGAAQQTYFAQYSLAGGDISITAGQDIERLTRTTLGELVPDSSRQFPNNWLYRRGYVDPNTGLYGATGVGTGFGSVNDPSSSTTWWVDYSNFFQSAGALGGGNVTLSAGRNISNVEAVAPTNARAASGRPSAAGVLELGGGDIRVRAGNDLDAGVFYVERGQGILEAGGSIVTNSTRTPSLNYVSSTTSPEVFASGTWLPTTLFLGKGSFDVSARGDVLLGPVTNPFLLPAGINNKFWYKTYFSTYSPDSAVRIKSLGGDVSLREEVVLPNEKAGRPILQVWLEKQNLLNGNTTSAFSQPWLRLAETQVAPFASLLGLSAPTLEATAFSGDINLAGSITLFPSASGNLELVAAGAINALQPTGESNLLVPGQTVSVWRSGGINLSDANPDTVPGVLKPLAYFSVAGRNTAVANVTSSTFLNGLSSLFAETGSTGGVSQTKQALHAAGLLHAGDPDPVRVYALGGNVSGLTLFSAKPALIHASRDITDVAFYLQNLDKEDLSVISAGRDIVPYNTSSPLRAAANAAGNFPAQGEIPLAGDLSIAGPGTLQVLAGRNLDLGTGLSSVDGTGAGLVSIGNARNPFLPFTGAHLIVGAGLGDSSSLGQSQLDFEGFLGTYGTSPEATALLAESGVTGGFEDLPEEERNRLALGLFYRILRDTGRNFNAEGDPGFGNYSAGFAAIDSLFGKGTYQGEILTRGRSIRTSSGGDISIFAPGGGLTLANTAIGTPLVPPGIITESGGNVSIFTDTSVDIGIGRIFTLRGGDMVIWSTTGDIAAGTSSKTVASAPPTRVLIDPQSADVTTDLAGLATGGGIGVLATVKNVPPGDVDLIAPAGVIDAGDAGIRVSGNISLAATAVVNAGNIAASGSSAGAPAAPAAPAAVSTTAPAPPPPSSTVAGADAAAQANNAAATEATNTLVPVSDIVVEVIGYGGSAGPDDTPAGDPEEEERKRRLREQADEASESDISGSEDASSN